MSILGFNKSKNVLGINILSDNMKVVMLRHTSEGKEVSFIESIPINKDASDDDIATALSHSLKDIQAKSCQSFLVISTDLAITKALQIPSIEDNEIRDILNLQAGRHTPYSREEIIIDYIKLGNFQNVYTKVLVIMVTREAIKRRLGILEIAGIKAQKILFAADGMGKMCSKVIKPLTPDSPRALLDIDAENSSFNIFTDSGLVFTRSIPVGAKTMKQDRDKGRERLVEELKKSFEAYQAEDISKNPNVLFTAGSNDMRSEINNTLSDTFKDDLKLEVSNMLISNYIKMQEECQKRIKSPGPISFISDIASLNVADSLTIDLIPEEVKLHRRFEEKGRKSVVAGILGMVIFFQICLIFVSKIYYADVYLKQLSDKYKERIEEADNMRLVSAKSSWLKSYIMNKYDAVRVVSQLYELLPDEIFLTGIKIDETGKIFIKGTSESMSRVFSFVTELENDVLFKGVKTEFTESRKEKEKDYSDFGISMAVERG